MGAKRITSHKHLLFFNKRVHGIRPVQIRDQQKTQCFLSDFHRLIVMHDQTAEFPVYDFFQESGCAGSGNDLQLRT